MTIIEVRLWSPLIRWNRVLITRMDKRQVVEFVENDEVEAIEIVCCPTLLAAARLRF